MREREYSRYSRRRKTKDPETKALGTMDKILTVIGITLVIFTIIMVITFWQYGAIPDTLVTCVFGACTGEAGFMGIIQATKNIFLKRKWEKEDRTAGSPQDPELDPYKAKG